MVFTPDIIMWRYNVFICGQLFIKTSLQNIFNHGVINPGTLKCSGAGGF